MACRRVRRPGPRRRHEHRVADPLRPRRENAQARGRGRCSCCCTGRSGIAGRRRATSSNGLPVAIRARPSVQAIRSAGVASAREVGFESGKMIGRSAYAVIARTISSVNVPGCPEVPIRMVGRAFFDHVEQADRLALGRSPRDRRGPSAGRASSGTAAALPARRATVPGGRSGRSLARASGSVSPSSTIAATSCSAMPQPAEPAPRIAMR